LNVTVTLTLPDRPNPVRLDSHLPIRALDAKRRLLIVAGRLAELERLDRWEIRAGGAILSDDSILTDGTFELAELAPWEL
jgi:hypothetical protein